jgi:hypothetical protein
LQLVDRLARVEQQRDGIGLPRIGVHLRLREPERILRLGLMLRAADDRDARLRRWCEARASR